MIPSLAATTASDHAASAANNSTSPPADETPKAFTFIFRPESSADFAHNRQKLGVSDNKAARVLGQELAKAEEQLRQGNSTVEQHAAQCREIGDVVFMLSGQLPVNKELLSKFGLQGENLLTENEIKAVNELMFTPRPSENTVLLSKFGLQGKVQQEKVETWWHEMKAITDDVQFQINNGGRIAAERNHQAQQGRRASDRERTALTRRTSNPSSSLPPALFETPEHAVQETREIENIFAEFQGLLRPDEHELLLATMQQSMQNPSGAEETRRTRRSRNAGAFFRHIRNRATARIPALRRWRQDDVLPQTARREQIPANERPIGSTSLVLTEENRVEQDRTARFLQNEGFAIPPLMHRWNTASTAATEIHQTSPSSPDLTPPTLAIHPNIPLTERVIIDHNTSPELRAGNETEVIVSAQTNVPAAAAETVSHEMTPSLLALGFSQEQIGRARQEGEPGVLRIMQMLTPPLRKWEVSFERITTTASHSDGQARLQRLLRRINESVEKLPSLGFSQEQIDQVRQQGGPKSLREMGKLAPKLLEQGASVDQIIDAASHRHGPARLQHLLKSTSPSGTFSAEPAA